MKFVKFVMVENKRFGVESLTIFTPLGKKYNGFIPLGLVSIFTRPSLSLSYILHFRESFLIL